MMQKPFLYTAIHKHTGEIREFNDWMLRPRPEYQPITETVSMEVYNWDIWEDTRYKAKLRLYNVLYWRRSGLLPLKLIRSTNVDATTNVHTKH